MWTIWHSRNRLEHDDEGLDPATSMRRTKEAPALLELQPVLPCHGWRTPEHDVIKITTDKATSKVGGMACPSNAFLGAWCKLHIGISDPLIAEAISLREGVRFANLHVYSHVMMEVDCLEMA